MPSTDDYNNGRELGCSCPVLHGRPWEPPRVMLSTYCHLERHRTTAAANQGHLRQAGE